MCGRISRLLLTVTIRACAVFVAASQVHAAITPEQEKFFETHIRPVLVDQCISCHGPDKTKGKLRLDSRAGFTKGGESGAVFEAGNPDASLMIDLIRYTNEVRMPPKKKLPDATVKLFEEWVKMGAPWPEDAKAQALPVTPASGERKVDAFEEARRTLWSLQPVTRPTPPTVKSNEAVANDVDRFIIAKLEAQGIAPSPRADRRTLIRRVTFDLIGLPPTFAEVEAFAIDKDADAWEKVIDRLLASPHYGERWGRHWLDVARYADTKGYAFTQDRRYPYSYTYRDYVIRAFNSDKPFDRFILEQIAADKLDLGADKRDLAAMGFLTVGRRFNFNIHDIIDDRIDVVTRGFMGMTVVCARCHDHKYDAIPTADYYSLYGVFRSSVEPDNLPLIAEPTPSPQTQAFEAELAKRKQVVADHLESVRKNIEKEMRERSGEYLIYIAKTLPNHTTGPVPAQGSRGELREKAARRWAAYIEKQTPDAVWSMWKTLAAAKKENFAAAAAEAIGKAEAQAKDETPAVNAKLLEALKSAKPQAIEQVAQVYGTLLEGVEKAWQESQEKGAGVPPKALANADDEQLRQVLYTDGSPAVISAEDGKQLINRAERDKERELSRKIEELQASHPGAPARAMVMNDGGMYDPYIFLRGQEGRRGERVPRRFLQVLSHVDGNQPFTQGSGRLELAQAIASRKNPLTARVYVNRVWQQHFGDGFTRDASDFGVRSDVPVHTELLDHLAANFMENGWSVKKLHKVILLSRSYQQASDGRTDAAAVDPENRFFWKMNRRRLELEPMRDALLAVAGRLDATIGGRGVNLFSQPFTTRRTVYGTIDRQDLPSTFRVFDLATPDASASSRPNTTVPQQALYMLNHPFIVEQAAKLVERAEIAKHPAEAERNITAMYQFAFARKPEADEVAIGKGFIEREAASGEGKAWQKYARALLMSNEFVFVD